MPVAGADLILVERMANRGGVMKPWHFWVRPEDLRPGDKKIEDPAFIAKMRATLLQNQANRARRKAERAEKKANGTATTPASASVSPPKAPDHIDTTGFDTRASALQQRAKTFVEGMKGLSGKAERDVALSKFLRTECKQLAEMSSKFAENVNQDKGGSVWSHDLLSGGRRKAEASYHPLSGLIDMRADSARELVSAIANGDVGNAKGAIEVYTHEVMHAASSEHQYEYSGSKRPHAAMEEATTELCAQFYARDMASALRLRDPQGRFTTSPQLFSFHEAREGILSGTYEKPSLTIRAEKPTAYGIRCKRFAQAVAAVEHMDVNDSRKLTSEMTNDNLNQSVRNWAYELKRTRGSLRYERLAHRYLQRAGLDSLDSARFASARAEAVRVLRDHLAETHKSSDYMARNERSLHDALQQVALRYRR